MRVSAGGEPVGTAIGTKRASEHGSSSSDDLVEIVDEPVELANEDERPDGSRQDDQDTQSDELSVGPETLLGRVRERRARRQFTFRARIIVSATVAVVVAVVLVSLGSLFVSRNVLVGSVDTTLTSRAQAFVNGGQLQFLLDHPGRAEVTDSYLQVIARDGSALIGPAVGPSLPVTAAVRSVALSGTGGFFVSVTVKGSDLRELVEAVPGIGAVQVATPLGGVDSELHRLELILAIFAAIGVILAVTMGWMVAHAVMAPVDALTGAIESLAETTDVSQRLPEGSEDELGRLRRAFNRLLEALDASRRSQRQLVMDASHELRTPLTSLRTNMELVRRLEELPVGEREVLVTDVLVQMEELTKLVSDLAELARGEPPDASRQPLRLDLLVEDAVGLATVHGRVRQIKLVSDLRPTWINANRSRVERAVGNLLDNALKWSPAQGVVEVSCSDGTVTVRDHGPGVPVSDAPLIFDRFYRAREARAMPGSGLGLAIVAQVAKDEGGQVVVESVDGGGALFRLSFPDRPELSGEEEESGFDGR